MVEIKVSGEMAPLHALNPPAEPEVKGVSFIRATDDNTVPRRDAILYPAFKQRDGSNNSIVMSILSWACRNIQQARPDVYQPSKDGMEKVLNHPLATILRKPQALINPQDRSILNGRMMNSLMIRSAYFTGQAFLMKERNSRGGLIGLSWLPPGAVRIVARRGMGAVIDYFEIETPQGTKRLPKEDIVWWPFNTKMDNPLQAEPFFMPVMRQVLTDNEIAVYSHAIMKAPSPSVVISSKDPMSIMEPDYADLLAKKVTEKSTGEKAGAAIVSTIPLDFAKMGFSPNEMAIDIIQKLPEERITALTGVPAVVVGLGAGLDRATYSNMKEAREAATEEFLVPLWDSLAECFSEQLLPEFDKVGLSEVKYDLGSVRALTEDLDQLHERARADFMANIINLAEARTIIGQKPQQGDDKIWAWMLKPTPASPMSGGQQQAAKARAMAEGLM
jgi:phage portal protein BeeE